jgi:tRNA wybutosine-synthesizing protein 4
MKPQPSISFELIDMEGPEQDFLSVFGAEAIDFGSGTAVCGGIGEHESQQGQTIVFISPSKNRCDHVDLVCVRPQPAEWPLMVGSSTVLKDKTLTVLGGGATCFSMGTYWETKSYQLDISGLVGRDHSISMDNCCQYLESPRILAKVDDEDTPTASSKRASIAKVPRVTLRSPEHFEELLRDGKPVIIESLDLGPCHESWTPEYMADRVGREKEVSSWLALSRLP